MPTRPWSIPVLARRAIIALAALAMSARPAQGQLPPEADDGVRPGDLVAIEFFTAAGVRPQELAGEHVVDREGYLVLPYVGRVNVDGLNVLEIRDLLVQRLSQYYENPIVVVRVQIGVNVTGAVRAPGHYLVDPTSTLVDLLSRAGGVSEQIALGWGQVADPSAVRLIRGARTYVLDMRPQAMTRETSSLRVQSGDWLYVPPAARSRWRDNLQLAATLLSLVSSVVILATR